MARAIQLLNTINWNKCLSDFTTDKKIQGLREKNHSGL
ncbi:hypothetical protein RT761_00868 [Atribacter laminatus]|uniref:Uncharacterized protein n=1 Tax=Atribacter laminatus TaxID=2847778 RepID=A0A7T1AKM1_ATRLM|nr:hypothetical protein RT761_00868 [Atribacter laminatus]